MNCPHPRNTALSRFETGLLLIAAALLALAYLGPALPASAGQHDFADRRMFWAIPYTFDVLSNLPFACAGVCGLALLHRVAPRIPDCAARAFATLFFAGLLCTAAGSALYHWQPQDSGLVWDRMGMALPFAGLIGLAAANRVSARAGWAAGGAWLLAGPLAVLCWSQRGNLLPWAVVQLGGMLVVLLLAALPRRAGALALRLWLVIALYALAKLFEAADHALFAASGQTISGHSLKHLLAAAAAWPVCSALAALRSSRAAADGGSAQRRPQAQ